KIGDIDLFEINEAFGAQVLACNTDLNIDEQRLNVNGGAVALGHPLGCSGARLTVTLTHEMRRRGVALGIAAMCIGMGQGIATVIEQAYQAAGTRSSRRDTSPMAEAPCMKSLSPAGDEGWGFFPQSSPPIHQ